MLYSVFQSVGHPQKCLFSCGHLTSPCNTFKTASRSVQLFSHSSRQRVPISYNVR